MMAPNRGAGAGAGPGGWPHHDSCGIDPRWLESRPARRGSFPRGECRRGPLCVHKNGEARTWPHACRSAGKVLTSGCDNHGLTQPSATVDQLCQKDAPLTPQVRIPRGSGPSAQRRMGEECPSAAFEGSDRPTKGLTMTADVGLVGAVNVHNPRGFK